jgi:hypothetical protein
MSAGAPRFDDWAKDWVQVARIEWEQWASFGGEGFKVTRKITLLRCPVCQALVDPDGREPHMRWHDRMTELVQNAGPS